MSELLDELRRHLKARQLNPDVATAAINYAIDMPRAIGLIKSHESRIAALEAAINEHKLMTQELCVTEDFDTALYNALNTEKA